MQHPEAISDLSATELAKKTTSGELSATEVTEAHIRGIAVAAGALAAAGYSAESPSASSDGGGNPDFIRVALVQLVDGDDGPDRAPARGSVVPHTANSVYAPRFEFTVGLAPPCS